MEFQAVLANAKHTEYGVATIPFPIKSEDVGNLRSPRSKIFTPNICFGDSRRTVQTYWPR